MIVPLFRPWWPSCWFSSGLNFRGVPILSFLSGGFVFSPPPRHTLSQWCWVLCVGLCHRSCPQWILWELPLPPRLLWTWLVWSCRARNRVFLMWWPILPFLRCGYVVVSFWSYVVSFAVVRSLTDCAIFSGLLVLWYLMSLFLFYYILFIILY